MRRSTCIFRPAFAQQQRLAPTTATFSKRLGLLSNCISSKYSTAQPPEGLKYTKSHEWVKVEGNVGTVGISDHAQDSLGEVVFVDLPEVGNNYGAKEVFGAVESVKTVSDLYTPVAGEVIEINEELKDEKKVSQINSDPFGKGWMIKIKLTNPADLDSLMDAKAYKEHCDSESH